MKKEYIKLIENYLDELYPNPKFELDYNNDYELLIAVVLSAQTTDKSVNLVTPVLFNKYPTLKDLKKADIDDVKNIIRRIGTYNKKASMVVEIAKILDEKFNGKVPSTKEDLMTMPGVGEKVANVILSEWFKVPAIAVDTHVNRVSKRLNLAKEEDSVKKVQTKLEKKFSRDNWGKRHLQLVLFGRYKCKSIKPLCSECKLKEICKYKEKN